MNVLYCASEASPLFKLGGLGDVAGSLPKALAKQGVDIRLALPYFSSIKSSVFHIPSDPVDTFQLCFGREKRWERVQIYQAKLPGSSVPVYLFHNSRYLSVYVSAREYGVSVNIVERFVFFSEAIAVWLSERVGKGLSFRTREQSRVRNTTQPKVGLHDISRPPSGGLGMTTDRWFPDIIHLNDWHVGLVAALVDLHRGKDVLPKIPKTLLTIHNLSYQGRYQRNVVLETEHTVTEFQTLQYHKESLNLLKLGIVKATKINTVSPTYAKEILTREYGEDLEGELKKRKKDLVGILNGIDYSVWNPTTDKYLALKLETRNSKLETENLLLFKKRNKYQLQKNLGLPTFPDIPLFAFIGRIEPAQKGIGILIHALEDVLPKQEMQVVVLGTGEDVWEERLHQLALHKSGKKKFVFADRFDESLAHQIYAGADFMLIPSKFEPCGLVQMIAMRYATIPVVRATGGLIDTVKDGKTGLVFPDYSAKSLGTGLTRALELYYEAKRFDRMLARIVREDFSWERSARAYVQLYKQMASRT